MLTARLLLLLGACSVAAGSLADPALAQERQRPNILWLYADDHAAHAVSAYGSPYVETPNLDRLATEGARFDAAFCGNSICGPCRATVLTGLHSNKNGFQRNGDRFDGSQRTFPKMLRAAGYHTAIMGKWHLGSDPTGFDEWDVLRGQGNYYNPDLKSRDGMRRVEGYCPDVVTDLALEYLQRRTEAEGDQPFLLMCQFKAPHRTWMPGPKELEQLQGDLPLPDTLFDDLSGKGPAALEHRMGIDRHMEMAYDLQCPIDEDERYYKIYQAFMKRMTPEQRAQWDEAFVAENAALRAAGLEGEELVRWKAQRYLKNYMRCIMGVDRNVGRLLDALDQLGLTENTLVVYTSDQGFFLGDHGWYDKRWMYEESLKVPLMARWPGRIRPGTVVDELVQNIDFAPTLVELAGLEVPDDMHGRSLLPLLRQRDPDWRDAIYYRYYDGIAVHGVAGHRGVRTRTHKLMVFDQPKFGVELYDLTTDPDEVHNLAGEAGSEPILTRLRARLDGLMVEYDDQ